MSSSLWQIETQETSPVPGVRLQSQAARIVFPFFNTTFTWNRPLAVLYITPEGQEMRLPVIDVTRWTQLSLVLGALMVIFLVRLFKRR
jgi:hypothetical protein